MNIKKFLIVTCLTLQFSTIIHASYNQDNFNKAFFTFGGGTDLAVAANNVKTNKGKSSSRGTSSGLTALGKTTEANIVVNYLINKALSTAETTALNNAFAVAQGTTSTTTPVSVVTPVPTPIVSTPAPVVESAPVVSPVASPVVTSTDTSSTQSATDVAAAALKDQINASVATYNSYLATVGQPQVKIAAA